MNRYLLDFSYNHMSNFAKSILDFLQNSICSLKLLIFSNKATFAKSLFIFSIVISQPYLFSDECSECQEEREEEVCVKFKRLPVYENSLVKDPIEREPMIRRPNSYESSFYEQLTR